MRLCNFTLLVSLTTFVSPGVYSATVTLPEISPYCAILGKPRPVEQIAEAFIHLDGVELLNYIHDKIPENRWLGELIGNEPAGVTPEGSFSMQVLGKYRPEFDRTAVALLSFRKILLNDYEGLTSHLGSSPVRPSQELFQELRMRILAPLAKEGHEGPFAFDFNTLVNQVDTAKLVAMVTFMAIHDMAKIPGLASSLELIAAQAGADHDRVLVQGIVKNQRLVAPTVKYLGEINPEITELIVEAMKPEINAGQAAQWEDNEAGLTALVGMPRDTLDFYFSHLYIDVMGVKAGLLKEGRALNQPFVISPVLKNFMLVHDVGRQISQGMPVPEAYLIIKGHHINRLNLKPSNPLEFAGAKLATLSRTTSPQIAQWISSEFLAHNSKENLTEYLNRTGLNKAAYFIEYAPEIFEKLIKRKLRPEQKEADESQVREATKEAIFLFSKMFDQAEPTLKYKKGGQRFIIGAKEVSNYLDNPTASAYNCPIELTKMGENALRVSKAGDYQ
jgi:hypothetical protein